MEDKKDKKVEEYVKTETTNAEEYPDHLKTKPHAKGDVKSIEDNLQQDDQAFEKYPDNIKTNPSGGK